MSDPSPPILNDIRAYLRIMAASASKQVALRLIDTFEKADVFSRLDGDTPQSKIEEKTSVAQTTISDWLKGYVESGLVALPSDFNRYHKALFSLRELGIDTSQLKKKKPTAAQVPPQGTLS